MAFDISTMLQRRWVVPTLVGASSFAAGAGAGYILAREIHKRRYVTVVDEVTETDTQMTIFDVVDEPSDGDPVEITVDEPYPTLEEADPIDGNVPLTLTVDEPYELVTANIFDHSAPDWDFEKELAERANREEDSPYVIHYDEYMENENDFAQETLTWYEGDDILADASDTPIYNYNNLLGELKFGHGSGDQNVVFIRNEKIKMEWEVLRHTGRFQVEVLGYELENEYEAQDLKHSTRHKFRME